MTDRPEQSRAPQSAVDIRELTDPGFLQPLREQMHKFATLQLGDASLAEDAVQEALVGALNNARSFGGRAALKTWVFAILKHKIADVLRRRRKDQVIDDDSGQIAEEGGNLNDLFNQKGFWHKDERPQRWDNPEGAFHQEEFWKVFELCLDKLPARQARVFMMREFIELESEEICASLELSLSNLHVILHRARLRLRECLEDSWFATGA